MRIQEISSNILRQLAGVNKWRRDFLSHLFLLFFTTRGRLNILNLSRYSSYNESTFHRHFGLPFDFTALNSLAISQVTHTDDRLIAAVDCSFINKSGKKTYGLDKFWSGSAKQEKTGLEISAISLVNTRTREAYTLEVSQTPPGLSGPGDGSKSYQKLSKSERRAIRSRIDFYVEQIERVKPYLDKHRVSHVVMDGYYTKSKVFETFDELDGLEMVGKLRADADLRYLYDVQESGPALTRRKYDGKVCYDQSTNGWRRWANEGHTENGLLILSKILYSVCFKRKLKVVACINEQDGKYILLFSTDLSLSAKQIVEFYGLRFQIEFLFRDAKQFTGLEQSQTRQKQKLHFHFNMSMSAINLARMDIRKGQTVESLNDYQRLAYNEKIINLFITNSALDPEFALYQRSKRESARFGLIRA